MGILYGLVFRGMHQWNENFGLYVRVVAQMPIDDRRNISFDFLIFSHPMLCMYRVCRRLISYMIYMIHLMQRS